MAFTGEANLTTSLAVALKQLNECKPHDQLFCDQQVKFLCDCGGLRAYACECKSGSSVATRAEAIAQIQSPREWTAERCRGCFVDELPPERLPTDLETRHPFATAAGLYQGVQFLDIGGASNRGVLTFETLRDFHASNLQKVKDAGFDGVCFDVEMTRGEDTGEVKALVRALEHAFKACKRAGLLVMLTTSHTAPFASSATAKQLLIESWIRDKNIDLFSVCPSGARTSTSIVASSATHVFGPLSDSPSSIRLAQKAIPSSCTPRAHARWLRGRTGPSAPGSGCHR